MSAPWRAKSRYQATSELVDLLVKSIGRKAFVGLARVGPIPTNDPNLKSILAEFPVDDGEPERRMRNVELFGLEMEEAIILRAKHPATKKSSRRELRRVSPQPTRNSVQKFVFAVQLHPDAQPMERQRCEQMPGVFTQVHQVLLGGKHRLDTFVAEMARHKA